MSETILVSACLLGLPTRYDGASKANEQVEAMLRREGLIPIPLCPEQLAGLPTPRPKTFFTRGTGSDLLQGCAELVDETGASMNETFLHGARLALSIAERCGCRRALLKEGSPSCGLTRVTLNGEPVPGMGVTSALLKQEGIQLQSEEQI